MGLQGMNNNHQDKDQLHLYDLITMFILKAPDQRKAIAGVMRLFGPQITKWALEYKKQYPTLQDWRNHLVAALDNAQEAINGSRKTPN